MGASVSNATASCRAGTENSGNLGTIQGPTIYKRAGECADVFPFPVQEFVDTPALRVEHLSTRSLIFADERPNYVHRAGEVLPEAEGVVVVDVTICGGADFGAAPAEQYPKVPKLRFWVIAFGLAFDFASVGSSFVYRDAADPVRRRDRDYRMPSLMVRTVPMRNLYARCHVDRPSLRREGGRRTPVFSDFRPPTTSVHPRSLSLYSTVPARSSAIRCGPRQVPASRDHPRL